MGSKKNQQPIEGEFVPKGRDDRRGLELIEYGATLLQKETIEQASRMYQKGYFDMSDCSVYDIVSNLAMYGGRLEVKGLGSFVVKNYPGKWKHFQNGDPPKWRPGRRMIEFKMAPFLRDALNENWFGDQEECIPNSEYFVKARNMII